MKEEERIMKGTVVATWMDTAQKLWDKSAVD